MEKYRSLPIPKEDYVTTPNSTLPWYVHGVRLSFGILGRLFPRRAGKVAFKLFTTPRVRARHTKSDELLASALAYEVNTATHTLKTYTWGASNAPTILLLHGWESRGTALRSFVPSLLQKGFRVVTFDAPAHGSSSGKYNNLLLYAKAIQSIWHQIGEIKGVLTHSFGGAAYLYCLSYLEPHKPLEKLVMIAAPNTMHEITENASITLGLPEEVSKNLHSRIEKVLGMPMHYADIQRMPGTQRIENILLIHDSSDQITTLVGAKQIVDAIPHAQLLQTDGLGHFQLVKHPMVIEAVSDFMAK